MLALHEWLLTPQRVAVHWPTKTAVVSDLHLGYAEARRRRGDAIPRESIKDLLVPLLHVRQQHKVHRLVVAGDLLEDSDCREALSDFLMWVKGNEIDLLAVIPGNHDLGLLSRADAETGFPLCPEGVLVGDWRIVHGEGKLPDAPVVHGHDHPCLRWSSKSRANRPRYSRSRFAPETINSPCFLSGPRRLILPAYSTEAAGINILSMPRWRVYRCHLVAEDRVLDLGEVSTLRRRLAFADSNLPRA